MDNKSSININFKLFSNVNCKSDINSLITETNNNEKEALNFELINKLQNGRINEEMSKQSAKFSITESTEIALKMKNLCLSVQKQETDSRSLAGYIKGMIWDSQTVIIQVAIGSKLLGIGTVLFLEKNNEGEELPGQEYREIGFISDIFGSVNNPMYSIHAQLEQRVVSDSLKVDAKVFYLHNHPSTRYISVKRDADNHYSVIEN